MLLCLFLAVTIIAAEQLRSFCRKIRQYYRYCTVISCFLWSRTTTNDKSIMSANYVCLRGMQGSQSDPARTQRRRRPPYCMIVTAMIVTVSPQCRTRPQHRPTFWRSLHLVTSRPSFCQTRHLASPNISTIVHEMSKFRYTWRESWCNCVWKTLYLIFSLYLPA